MGKLSLLPRAVNLLGETLDAERNLWRNVIIIAFEDALGKHWKNKSYGLPQGNNSERARAWFSEPNRDFALVCQYAGFDHEYVRQKAIKFFKEKENEEKNMPEVHWEWVHKSERDSGSTT